MNTVGGKCNRGMSVPDSVSMLLGRPLSEDEYFKAAALGWMTELLQAFFLVSDDIMDASITRRGKPCWYRQEGVGMVAINDAIMLEISIYTLLRHFFRGGPGGGGGRGRGRGGAGRAGGGRRAGRRAAPED